MFFFLSLHALGGCPPSTIHCVHLEGTPIDRTGPGPWLNLAFFPNPDLRPGPGKNLMKQGILTGFHLILILGEKKEK